MMPLLWFGALLLSVLLYFAAANVGECDDPLECYLNDIVLTVPDVCLSIGIERVCLNNMRCDSLVLESIPSQYSEAKPTTLGLGVSHLGFDCSLEYSIGWIGLLHGTADMILSEVDALLSLLLGKDAPPSGSDNDHDYYPISASLSSCNVTSEVDISFSSPVADKVSPLLEAAVKQLLYDLICGQLQQVLQENVTDWMIGTLTPALQDIIHSESSPLPSDLGSHYYNWGDSFISTLRGLLDGIDTSSLSSVVDTIKCFLSYNSTTPSTAQRSEMRDLRKKEDIDLSTHDVTNEYYTLPNEGFSGQFENDRHASSTMNALKEVFDMFAHSQLIRDGAKLGIPFPVATTISWPGFPPGCNSSLSIDMLRVDGINSINDFQLLEPHSFNNYTLHSSIGFDSLVMAVEGEIQILCSGVSNSYRQAVEMTLVIQNVTALLDLAVALNSFVMKSLYMDQVNTLDCFFHVLDEFSVANFQLHLYNITDFRVSQRKHGSAGQLEVDLAALLENAVRMIMVSPGGFQQLTADAINGIFQGYIREIINERIYSEISFMKKERPCMTHYPYDDSHDYIAWSNSTLIATLDYLMNELIGAKGMNALFSCATNGTASIYFDVGSFKVGLGGLDSFFDLTILTPMEQRRHLSSGHNEQTSTYGLASSIGVGYCGTEGRDTCNPLWLSLQFNEDSHDKKRRYLTSSNQLSHMIEDAIKDIDLKLSLSNAALSLKNNVQIDRDVIRDIKLGQVGVTGCLASSLEDFSFEDVHLGVSEALLYWSGQENVADLTDLTSRILDFLTSEDRTKKTNDNISNQLADAEVTCKNDGINPYAQVESSSSSKKDDDDDDDDFDWWWQMLILVLAGICSLIALLWAYNHYGRAKKLTCTPVMTLMCKDDIDAEDNNQRGSSTCSTSEEKSLVSHIYLTWGFDSSLICHGDVPLWLRLIFPIAVLGNIALFLDSNLTDDAVSVLLEIEYKDKSWDKGSIFDFGLGNTVQDMWDAKVYVLASLILFFSGCWPYIKLVMMLVSWTFPIKVLSIEWRETSLVILDVLGKWSLIDFFVMILMLCAFYYNIYIAQDLEVHVTVRPNWGFYSFLLATMISLALGHIALACHRLIVEPKMLPIPEHLSPKVSLSTFIYQIDLKDSSQRLDNKQIHDKTQTMNDAGEVVQASNESEYEPSSRMHGEDGGEVIHAVDSTLVPNSKCVSAVGTRALDAIDDVDLTSIEEGDSLCEEQSKPMSCNERQNCGYECRGVSLLVSITPVGQWFGVLCILTTTIFIIAGTFMITMSFDFKGLVGLLLKDDAEVKYSFVDVGTSVPKHSGIPNNFAVRWMQGSFFVFGQAMPFGTLLLLMIMWLVPLSIARQRILLVLTEVLNAWSALDVFCVAIAAALMEIQQFAKFIVGDSCDSVDKYLEKNLDDVLDGDDTCFDVVAELKSDSWVIFTAAAMMIVVALPIIQMSKAAYHRRQNRLEQALLLYSSKQEMAEMEELISLCQKKGLHVEPVNNKRSGNVRDDSRCSSLSRNSENTEVGAKTARHDGALKRVNSSRTTLEQYQQKIDENGDVRTSEELLEPLLMNKADYLQSPVSESHVRLTLSDADKLVENNQEEKKEFNDSIDPDNGAEFDDVDSDNSIKEVQNKEIQAGEIKEQWYERISYANAVIMFVNICSRCGLVEIAYMYTSDASKIYASKLTDEATFPSHDSSNIWLCKWDRLPLSAADWNR